MEFEAERFYSRPPPDRGHRCSPAAWGSRRGGKRPREIAAAIDRRDLNPDVRAEEDKTSERTFVLQYVQPGLAGLMDGSVSTLAPLFAAAFATHHNWQTLLVGFAASIGAGISMAFAEALSDDGSFTGRGSPWLRGAICGAMTTRWRARPLVALSRPRHLAQRFLDRDFDRRSRRLLRTVGHRLYSGALHGHAVPQAAFQIVLGGVIVLAVGIPIGAA